MLLNPQKFNIKNISLFVLIPALIIFLFIIGCAPKFILWSGEIGPADGGKYRGIAAGDFNNDGSIDLVGGFFQPGGTKIYWGHGDGTWHVAGMASRTGEIRSIESADFNEDGFDDIVITTWGDLKGVHVYFSDGTGGWYEEIPPQESWSYEGLDIGDFNNDGHIDIVAANASSDIFGGVSVWFGTGEGVWTEDYGPAKGDIYRDVVIADFNRDGIMDIAATSWGIHGGIKIWLGDGQGGWRETDSPREKADFWGIDAADFNMDGYPDIAAGTYNEGLAVWYGGPQYAFRQWDHIKLEGSVWNVIAEDFDKDGFPDIAASTFDGSGILFYRNDKGKSFTDFGWQFPEKTDYFGLTAADINNDGKLDLAAANPGEGLHVWVQGSQRKRLEPLKIENTDMFVTKQKFVSVPEESFSLYYGDFSYEIGEDQDSTLNKIADLLDKYPYSIIRLEGHADPRKILVEGKVSSNSELSEKRALAVKEALLQRSRIDEKAFTYVGFGDAYPVSMDKNEYWKSRRADVFIQPRKMEIIHEFVGRDAGALRLSENFVDQISDSFKVEPPENLVYATILGTPEYKVGPSDVIKITVWEGRTPKEYIVIVQVDGSISFAYNPNMVVLNLTPTQIKNEVMEALSEYFKEPHVNIDIIEYNARKASILGQERDLQRTDTGPGQYPLTGKTRIVDFISKHGGPTNSADLAQVKVVRSKGQTYFLNLYKAMFEGDVTQNLILDDGDVIFIPSLEVSARKFYILGEVANPGVYELKDEVNILEAIMIAGSFTDRASLSRVAIIRGDLTRPEVLFSNIEAIIHKGDQSENVEIQNGDIIYVSRHVIGDINFVLSQVLPALNTLFLYDRLGQP